MLSLPSTLLLSATYAKHSSRTCCPNPAADHTSRQFLNPLTGFPLGKALAGPSFKALNGLTPPYVPKPLHLFLCAVAIRALSPWDCLIPSLCSVETFNILQTCVLDNSQSLFKYELFYILFIFCARSLLDLS